MISRDGLYLVTSKAEGGPHGGERDNGIFWGKKEGTKAGGGAAPYALQNGLCRSCMCWCRAPAMLLLPAAGPCNAKKWLCSSHILLRYNGLLVLVAIDRERCGRHGRVQHWSPTPTPK